MLSALLSKIGMPLIISIFSESLSHVDHPVAKEASNVLGRLNDAVTNGDISSDAVAEMNRHAEVIAQLKSDEYRTQIAEINQSLRAEVASQDAYVRRMRPTFGYIMAITWAAQMLALAWVILEDTKNASLILESFESLGIIWTIGLSVLGIYVYKRSEEKKVSHKFIDAYQVNSKTGLSSQNENSRSPDQSRKENDDKFTASYNS